MTDLNSTSNRANTATTSRLALSIFGTALLLGVLGDVLLRPMPWGLNMLLWVLAIVLSIIVVARWRKIPLTGGGRWLFGPALLFAALFALRDSIMLNAANLLAILICLALIAYRALQGRLRVATLTDYATGLVTTTALTLFGAFMLVFDDIKWKQVSWGRPSRHAASVGTGLLIAIPALFVFGSLLASADAVFQELIGDLFNWDLYEIFSHAFWIGFWAWVMAGFLRMTFLFREGAAKPAGYRGLLGAVEVSIVLGSLIALFAGFVIVQFRYLFGGVEALRSVVNLSYAEYARRGFFELVTVAALALGFLLLLHWLLKKSDPHGERSFRWLSAIVIGLLYVIMASALYRMRLYQIEFGLTELRLYTTAFMGWLALVFVWFGVTVLRGQSNRFAFGALASGLAVLLVLNVLNPDDFIVRANTGRVEAANPFDASYVVGLSADAVPALIAALPTMTGDDRCLTAARILRRWSPPQKFDGLAWNLDRVLAWQAVNANAAYLQRVACPQANSRSD